MRFSTYDVFVTVLSAVSYLADVVTDIWLLAYFFSSGHTVWGTLTLCFVAVASIMMQVFSFHWQVTDRTLDWKTFLIHATFLAPLYRYMRVLHYGYKSRKSRRAEDLDCSYREVNDVCILRLFETFLEAAPQLVLQLYIILSDLNNFHPIIVVSTVLSLLSITWAVTAYTDALHLVYKKLYKRNVASMTAQTVWQLGMIASRVLAVVLIATVFHAFVAIPLGLHWIIMVMWIGWLRPQFGTTVREQRLFVLVSALIHVFCYLNLKDGSSRWRMLFYYTLTLAENAIFVSLWFVYKATPGPVWLDFTAFSVVFGGFVLGALSLLLYYSFCHPSGPQPLNKQVYPQFHKPTSLTNQQKADSQRGDRPAIFDVSSMSARINDWLHASLDLSKEGLTEDPDAFLSLPGDPGNITSIHTRVDVHMSTTSRNYINTSHPVNDASQHEFNDVSRSMDRCDGVIQEAAGHAVSDQRCDNSLSDQHPDHSLSDQRPDHSLSDQRPDHSLSDQNIVEMFSRCKLDPSFVSTGSFNDSAVHLSDLNGSCSDQRIFPGGTLTGNASTAQLHGSLSNDHSNIKCRPSLDSVVSLGREGGVKFVPTKMSPLDPYKLMEESGLGQSSTRSFLWLSESDTALNRSGERAVITVQPDVSRGIARLSLSYSALDTNDSRTPPKLKDTSARSEIISPVYSSDASFGRIGVSFSDVSLPLPKSTSDLRNVSNYDAIGPCHSLDSGLQYENNILNQVKTDRFNDSFYTDSPVIGRQLMYSSGRVPLSDRRFSSAETSKDRSQKSLTSSGFQSESSNFSFGSPSYVDRYSNQDNFQSTPILENEITTIPMQRAVIQLKRDSLEQEVCMLGKMHTTTCSQSDKINSPLSSFKIESAAEIVESPILPPLRVASRRSSSSNSGRYFSDPSLVENTSPTCSRSDSQATDSDSNYGPQLSLNKEQSTLSAFLSDMSSSKIGDFKSSDESLSLRSKSVSSSICTNALSGDEGNVFDSVFKSESLRANPEEHSKLEELYAELSEASGKQKSLDQAEESTRGATGDYVNVTQTSLSNPISYSREDMEMIGKVHDKYLAKLGQTPGNIGGKSEHGLPSVAPVANRDDQVDDLELMDDSPYRLGRNVDIFDSEKWRNGLDKHDQPVVDVEKLAPTKLNKLRAKSDMRKKLSPVNISVYNDSPYKFRRSTEQSCRDYENVENARPSSMSSEFENMHPITGAIYTDYQNVYTVSNDRGMNCPIATPESLSDNVVQHEPLGPSTRAQRKLDMTYDLSGISAREDTSPNSTSSSIHSRLNHSLGVTGERNSLNSSVGVTAADSSLSGCVNGTSDLSGTSQINSSHSPSGRSHYNSSNISSSRNGINSPSNIRDAQNSKSLSNVTDASGCKSPINTSGMNSAFKPVKSKRNGTSETLTCDGSGSNSSHAYSDGMSTSSFSSGGEATDGSRDNSWSATCPAGVSHGNGALYSSIDDTCNSTFQWSSLAGSRSRMSQDTSVVSERGDQQRNYLAMAGQSPFSFSMAGYPTDENSYNDSTHSRADLTHSCADSTHSRSNSIPWEDSVNKSNLFSNSITEQQSSSKSVGRQPLRALENTPMFSPILGQGRRLSSETCSSRKWLMSTPKLSVGSEMSVSSRSSGSLSLSNMRTPSRRRSGAGSLSCLEDTSVWSGQNESAAPELDRSVFSSLSKTTYI